MAVTGHQMVGDRNSPGPGAYDVRGINKTSICFTIRKRTEINHFGTGKNVPGPGQYPLVGNISKNGKYFVSKFKNSGAPTIAPRSSSTAAP